MANTTIAVPEEARDELTKVAAELQMKTGRRVDLGEAVHLLLHERRHRAELLEKACRPLPGAGKALDALYKERKEDERRTASKLGV